MSKEELLALITNASTVIISVLGKTINIMSSTNGSYSIEDRSQNSLFTFPTAFEMLEKYMVMNMSLESLIPWMNVTSVT